MTQATKHHVTEHWVLDPPVDAAQRYGKSVARISVVRRTVYTDVGDALHHEFRGRLLLKSGEVNPNSALDSRWLADEDEALIVALLPEA